MTRNAIAELQHGRQGGGWVPKAKLVESGHVMHVACEGGPHAGTTLAMHHWGPTALAPKIVPVPDRHGRYVLGTKNRPAPAGPQPVYRWENTDG